MHEKQLLCGYVDRMAFTSAKMLFMAVIPNDAISTYYGEACAMNCVVRQRPWPGRTSRSGDREVEFTTRLHAFAEHWRFRSRACARYRAGTKGKG